MLRLNANWFPECRFATVSGLGNTIGLTGALAGAAPLAWLVTLVSWRQVFLAPGSSRRCLSGKRTALISGLNNLRKAVSHT
jgi:hypothetical protein